MISVVDGVIFMVHAVAGGWGRQEDDFRSVCMLRLLHNLILANSTRTLVKSVYQKNNFLISQPKHMLWVR